MTVERLQASLVGRYALVQELGQGGMATVYLARDVKHDREVALKVLRPELAAILGRERFLSEVRLTARLDHPHILTLLDSGESDGFLWYTLPYIRGESLRHKLDRETQLGVDEAVSITRQIAGALEHAHQHGIIHRDVKPENILLHEGEAMLADFGIALAVKEAGGQRLTETGLSLGTPQYMSPEQATAERTLDARSDVYSLGAVLYEMLAGEPPFTGATGQAVIAKLMVEAPSSLRTVRGTVPPGLEAVVLKALSKVPADRFPTAAAFAEALAAPETQRAPRRARKGGLLATGLGVALVAAAAVWLLPRLRSTDSGMHRGEPTLAPATFSGGAHNPALSPDGKQLAYGLSSCAGTEVKRVVAFGTCRISIVVEDLSLGEHRTLADPFELIFGLNWSPDQQFLTMKGVRGDVYGQYLLSLFGGRETYLGTFRNGRFLGNSDTIIASFDSPVVEPYPEGEPHWFYLLSRDGRRVDSIPYRVPAAEMEPLPSPDGRQIVAYPDAYLGHIGTIYLMDREGRVTDSLAFPTGFQVSNGISWEPSGRGLLLFTVAERGPPERWSLLRFSVSSDGKVRPVPDTVISRLLLPGTARGTVTYALSPPSRGGDHAILLNAPTTSVLTVERPSLTTLPVVRATLIPETTAELGARISPDGARVAVLRPVVVDGKPATQVEVWPYDGGVGTPLGSPLRGLRGLSWSGDSRAIYHLSQSGRPGLLEYVAAEAASGRILKSLTVPDSLKWRLCDSLLIYPARATSAGRSIEWTTPPAMGASPISLAFPDTTAFIEGGALVAQPGGGCIVARMTSRAFGDTVHSVYVARPGVSAVRMMDFTLTESLVIRYFAPPPKLSLEVSGLTGGQWRWFRIEPGRPVRDLGSQPGALQGTDISFSADGRRGVAVKVDERPDVWLLRWPADSVSAGTTR
jgi:tRNA A-37 threonylcarbamoyl transferase component Bud32